MDGPLNYISKVVVAFQDEKIATVPDKVCCNVQFSENLLVTYNRKYEGFESKTESSYASSQQTVEDIKFATVQMMA